MRAATAQRGAILPLSLGMLLLLSTLATGALRDNALAWRMGGDDLQRQVLQTWADAAVSVAQG